MKQKDVITGWLVAFIISCMMLAGCTEKARKLEKKNVKVETISVGNTNLGGTKDYVGTIEEKMGSTLSFEIAGNITSIRVEEGDRVSKGQLLATINPTTVKEAHRATFTTLKQAQDAYRRFLPLHQSGTISDMKWVEIESKLEQAKAAESIARQHLYATFSSWHIDPYRFPMRCGKNHCIKDLYNILFLFSSKRQHITYLFGL